MVFTTPPLLFFASFFDIVVVDRCLRGQVHKREARKEGGNVMSRNEIDLEAIIVQRVLVNFERFQQYETLQHSLRYILTFSQTTLTTPTKDTISFNTKKVTHLSHGNAIRRNVAIVFLTNLEPKNEPCPFLPASSAGHSQTAAPTSTALLKNLSSLSLSAAANRPRPTHGGREGETAAF